MGDLKAYLQHRNYLWGMCGMTQYEPENEDLYYKLTVENATDQFNKLKDLWKTDKKKFVSLYKYITELEMFINRRWFEAGEYWNYEENKWFWLLWEKMHDFNCSKFDYGTPEWKYYFQTID